MALDNNVWYTRVGICNYRTKCTSLNVRYCYDVNFFINLFNKIKSFPIFFPFFVWVEWYLDQGVQL